MTAVCLPTSARGPTHNVATQRTIEVNITSHHHKDMCSGGGGQLRRLMGRGRSQGALGRFKKQNLTPQKQANMHP